MCFYGSDVTVEQFGYLPIFKVLKAAEDENFPFLDRKPG